MSCAFDADCFALFRLLAYDAAMLRLDHANLIEIRDLHFAYGSNKVIDGLELDIPQGKVVAILGASGCGKTTLLQLIGGALKPARGSVRVYGQEVHALDHDGLYRLRREIGMMFQKGGLFTDLSVFENIAFPIREHTTLPEAIITNLVKMKLHAVGLRGAHHLYPIELSAGRGADSTHAATTSRALRQRSSSGQLSAVPSALPPSIPDAFVAPTRVSAPNI